MAQWQTPDLLAMMEDEDDDADLREALALSMRTYEAEHPGAGQGQAQQLPSSSPEADTDADDDLQQALELSMRTYEAEQQHGPGQQHLQRLQEPSRQLNKRSNSPAAADSAGPDARLAALAGTAVAEEAAPAKKPRSSNSPWQQATALADGAAQLYLANSSNLGVTQQQGAAAAGTDAGFTRQPNSATALLLASSGLLALGQAPAALQLLALQQHNLQQQQQNLQQRQQQVPAAGCLLARCMPSPACDNPQQPAAARAQPGLGRSGAVQDFGQLARDGGTLAGNTTAAAENVDLDLYDLGDWGDEGDDDDMASRGSGGSGVAGMYAHYSAMQLNEQPRRQLQQQQQQQQHPAQQQQHQGLPRSGRGSSSSDLGARRLYQLREPVWYIDPLYQTCFRGCVFGADVAEQGGSSAVGAGGSISSRYIVDLQCAAVRYVEANAAQLLPRLCAGDWVWCKPSMAHHNQLGAASKQRMQLQQQQQQQHHHQQQQQQAGHDPWFAAEWVLGQVASAQLHLSVPVCEVRLADGDSCWFPNIHLEAVREVGESSSAAEGRGAAQIAAAAAMTDVPAAEAADASDVAAGAAELQQQQQQQQPVQLPAPLQQQAEQTAGTQQQQRTAEMPLVPSSGSGQGLHAAGSTGSVRCAAQGSCGAGAAPDMANPAGADASAQGMEMDAAAPNAAAAAAGPDAADVPMVPTGSLRGAAAADEEEVADSTDLLLLLPPAEGAGDSREEAAQGQGGIELGKAGRVEQQLPAAAVAAGEPAALL